MKNFTRVVVTSVLTSVAFLWVSSAGAAPISIGQLSSNDDGSTDIIEDTLNNRQWLRTDVLDELTFAQTQLAIGLNGAFEGWQIADLADAQLFVDALFGANPCTTNQVQNTLCGTLPGGEDLIALTGSSHYGGTSQSLVWFLSSNALGEEVGFMHFDAFSDPIDRVFKYNEWGSIAASDAYSGIGGSDRVGWLLYRDTQSVPTPGSLGFLAFGVMLLWYRHLAIIRHN